MTEKELGQALLNVDAASSQTAPNARQLAQRILKKDEKRIRVLTGLATFFWILTAVAILCICPFYILMVAPRLRAYDAGRAHLERDWNAWATVGDWAAYWVLGCIISFLLAAVCTVLLIRLSRRATLRQINVSLGEISEQLRQLQQLPTNAPPGTNP